MSLLKEKLQTILFFIKKYWIVILIGVLVAVLLIAYLAGLVTQLNASGNTMIGGGEKQPIDKNVFENFRISFATEAGRKTFSMFFVFIIVAGVVIYAIKKIDNSGTADPDRNFDYSKKNTYGTSGWMDKKEMNEALEVKPVELTYGTILGAVGNNTVSIVPTIRKDSVVQFTEEQRQKSMRTNKHVCVMGSSGSMKSRAYVRPYIFQSIRRGESLIITDPKGEMYEDMAELLRKEGYHVNIFNLKDQTYSDSWDCLAEVTDEVMAQIFCSVIIQNTGGARGDHFWDNAEMNLLKALVLYVTIEHKKNNRPITMPEVYRLLTTQTVSDLERMFKILPQTHPAYVPYAIYAQAGDNVRGNVVIGLSSRIQVFQSQVTKNITSFPEIDLTRPGREKCAYFCAISDQDATFAFLSSLFFAFLFIKLVKYADMYSKTPGKLDVPVNFVLDEFSNIGSIPDFEKKISTVRSRDINISVIIQSIPQLKNRYPNDVWQEIIGNCDTQLFLGCTDEMTAKYISDRSGVATIDIQSEQTVRKTLALAQVVPEYKKTESVGKRNVMTQDEVMRLKGKEALVIIRGEKLLKVKKFDFTRHPMSKEMVPCRINARIPRWRRREMEAEADGYELRTEKRGGGTLYYFNPKTGIFYERTAFINANSIDELEASIPKGDTVKVAVDKSVGYQIVKDDEGITYVVNSQTGETRLYYGFDENGNLKTGIDEPMQVTDTESDSSDCEYIDEMIPEMSDDAFFGTAPPLFDDDSDYPPVTMQETYESTQNSSVVEPLKEPKKKHSSSLSGMFDALIGPNTKRGTAKLETDLTDNGVSDTNTKCSSARTFTDVSALGSTPTAEKIFDEPEDTTTSDNPTDIWSGLRAEICADNTGKKVDVKPTEPAKPKCSAEVATAQPSVAHGNTGVAENTAKPAQPKQKGSKLSGQKPKQNMNLFSLDKKEQSKPAMPAHSSTTETDDGTALEPEINADDLFEAIPSTNPIDYVPDNNLSEMEAIPDSRRNTATETDPDSDEDCIDELSTAMSAAEILGELQMEKSKKDKKGRNKDISDKDHSDTQAITANLGRDEPASDWDYAFVNSDELFD